MGQIVASGNLKGGTGKSTIAVNVACALAARGHAVVVLDVDPQGTASQWARRGLLPVWAEAAPADMHGAARWQSRAVELARNLDLVVLDLPPVIGPALAAALMIADLVLVPITPSAVDVGPTADALRLVRTTRETRGGRRPRALLVPNKVDPHGQYDEATQRAVEGLRERWAPPISQDTAHVNAFAAGSWTGGYAPQSLAARELEALTDAVEAMLGLPGQRSSERRPPLPTRMSA